MQLTMGEVLEGRYRIIRKLGEGGMGQVYLAEDLKLPSMHWAVKAVPVVHSTEHQMDELDLLIRLRHPALPYVADRYIQDGILYIVMEYIKGLTLQERFEQDGRLWDWRRTVQVAIQLCNVLEYLHCSGSQPIIHRDLKPANVMMDDQGTVRLIDFGTARTFKPGRESDTLHIGSIGFAAPEQLQGQQTTQATDLYQLGAFMYYLLNGGKYYNLHQVPLKHDRPDLPQELLHLIDRLLEHRPHARIQDASAAGSMLMSILSQRDALHDEFGRTERPVPKHIVVGSLYPGAGSTTAAFALSAAMHAKGIAHHRVEWRNSSNDWHRLQIRENAAVWQQDTAPDLVLPPLSGNQPEHWNLGMIYPIAIVDISDEWQSEGIDRLLEDAAELVLVVDPSYEKWHRSSSRSHITKLMRLQGKGKRMLTMMNKYTKHPFLDEWRMHLPGQSYAEFPLLPYEQLVYAQWSTGADGLMQLVSKPASQVFSPIVHRLELSGVSL